MKRKLTLIVTSVVFAVSCAFGLAACGGTGDSADDGAHTHDYRWVDNQDGTHKRHCSNSGCDAPDVDNANHDYGAGGVCVCGKSEQKEQHIHTFDKQVTEPSYLKSQANCTQKALYYYSCDCGEKGTETFEHGNANGHSFTNYVANNDWTCTVDGTKTATCDNCTEEDTVADTGSAKHKYQNGVCDVCGGLQPTVGLEYKKFTGVGGGICAAVVGIGTATDTDVVIAPAYNGTPVTIIRNSAFKDCVDLTSVTIPNTVTHIESFSFSGCTGLTEITIPDGVTDIGGEAFSGCIGLTEITIPKSVINIEGSTFCGCAGLTELTVESGNEKYHGAGNCIIDTANKILVAGCKTSVIPDNGSVTNIGYQAFYDCFNLTSITIPEGVTSIDTQAFAYSGLSEIIIPNSVTNISEQAFYKCGGLTSVTISENVSGIKGHAFEDCDAATIYCEVNGKPDSWDNNWEPSYALGIDCYTLDYGFSSVIFNSENNFTDREGYAYAVINSVRYRLKDGEAEVTRQPKSLSGNIMIPETVEYDGNNYRVKSVGINAFTGCDKVTGVTVPNSVTSIGDFAFADCRSLTSITIPQSVTQIGGGAFVGDSGITQITVASGNEKYHSAGNCVIETASKTLAAGCKNSVIPDDGSVTSIGEFAFIGCGGLEEIEIPTGVTNLGRMAFYSCNGLENVVLLEGLTVIGPQAFGKCANLKTISIPDSITSVGDGHSGITSFNGCDKLQYNEYGNAKYLGNESNPYLVLIEPKDSNITSCTIHSDTKVIASSALENCGEITQITIPDSVVHIGLAAFRNCGKLTDLTVGYGLINTTYAFNNYNPEYNFLKNIHISDLAKWCAVSQYYSLPEGITLYLNGEEPTGELIIPDGVTKIGDNAFNGCSKITSVTIPDSVTEIGENAFYGCTVLTAIKVNDLASWCGVTGINNLLSDGRTLYLNGEEPTGELIIPDGVTKIGDYAFYGCNKITSITIPDSVTEIGEHAFDGCLFESVTIPAFAAKYVANQNLKTAVITSGTRIDNNAFADCGNLKNITVPDSVTEIGESAFSGCPIEVAFVPASVAKHVATISLKTVIITSGDTIENNTFNGCDNLSQVTVPDSVTEIGQSAFYNCPIEVAYIPAFAAKFVANENLKTVEITSGTSVEDSAFYGCGSLASVTIKSGVATIGEGAFQYCSGLKIVAIPDSVTEIGAYAFYGCSSLTEVSIPSGVTKIDTDTFSGCSSLTEVTISEGVTSIGSSAFADCIGLTSIVLPQSVKEIHGCAFENCSGLTSVNIPDGVTLVVGSAFIGCSKLIQTEGGVNYVDKWAINCDKSVTELILRADTKGIADTAFSYFSELTSITIGNNVTTICEGAFNGCSGLSSITIPDSVTTIGERAFYGCKGLTSISIGNGVTTIGEGAFAGCSGLTSITVDGGNTKYYSTGDCLIETATKTLIRGCKNGQIPNDGSILSIGAYAFSGCSEMTSVVIPQSVKEIHGCAFENCSGLTSVNIPDGVTLVVGSAFIGCSKLIQTEGGVNYVDKWAINCDKSVTELNLRADTKGIADSAFSYCIELISITIGNGVTIIGEGAFQYCSGLEIIKFEGTREQWEAINKENLWDEYSGEYIVACSNGILDKSGVAIVV